MAFNQYISVKEQDLGGGIDQESAENNIPQGYCEDLLNMDPKSSGQAVTRAGYQGYLGYLPVRVVALDYNTASTDNLCLTLDTGIDISTITKSPLVVFGRTSNQNTNDAGDFPTNLDSANYYSTFTTDFRKSFLTGTNTLDFNQAEHLSSTEYIMVRATESLSLTDNSNQLLNLDNVVIDTSTDNIDLTYTNNTGSTFQGFTYILENDTVAGTSYRSGSTAIGTGTNTYTITAATHGLASSNILVDCYRIDGTDLVLEQPDTVVIKSNGNVEITFTSVTAGFDAVFLLRNAGTTNVAEGTIANLATQTIQLNNLSSPFLFVAVYLEDIATGDREQVLANSIVIDATTNTGQVSFTNNSGSGKSFSIYYVEGQIVTNRLCVDASVIGSAFSDTAPELTIWGLKHSEIYGTDTSREGWVNLVDSYRSINEDRLVAGLGGNLFKAALRTENNNSSTYLLPQLYPNLRGRTDSDLTIGPVFYDSTDTPSRSRGFIKTSTAGNNYVEISSATYQPSTGYTLYRLVTPDQTVSGTLSDIINTAAGFEDRLTVQQMGYSKLNGSFKIKQVVNNITSIDIYVDNPAVVNDDTDEVDAGGLGGVFTDKVVFASDTVFLSGDLINDQEQTFFNNQTILEVNGTDILVDNVVEQVNVPGGLRVVGTRTTSVIGLRDIEGTKTVADLVRGDMLSFTGISRQLRVNYIRTEADVALTITGDSSTNVATAVLGSGNTDSLAVGQAILIRDSTSYNQEHVITAIPTSSSFQFSSSGNSSESAVLVGQVINIDESLEISDTVDSSNIFTVVGRFVPIESPKSEFDLVPETVVRYLDSGSYINQSFLRSVMVQNNLYLTNGNDEVMKFDGTNIYRAGLFRWQPHMFVGTDTSTAGKIILDTTTASYTASANNRFTVADADRLSFPVGTLIKDSIDGAEYTVINTQDDGTSSYIYVNKSISSTFAGTPDLSRVSRFRYYFRLNAVDANNNLIASAVTGDSDTVVNLGEDASVRLRLLGMPVWDIYDYDRLEVQIYRTQAGGTVFYRLTTLPISFNNNEGYIDYLDTSSDEDLVTLDEINTALYGSELGTTMSEPIRAKYITSADNRLILSNLIDYPTIDLRLIQNNSGPITRTALIANARYLFRKDNIDTGTDTNMLDRAAYEFTGTTSVVSGVTGTAGTSFSVACTGHGLTAAGQWVYLFYPTIADGNNFLYAGWWQVASVTNADNFAINYPGAGSGAASTFPTRVVSATVKTDIPVYLGTDGNYGMANGNRDVAGPYEFVAIKRLANAINASMRMTDVTLSGQATFSPWMIGNAGNEFNVGQLVVRQPKVLQTNLELQLPTLTGAFDVFVNDVKRVSASSAGALTRSFPSRTIQSFSNFPEIFDAPTANQDSQSLSAIDVNSADGQEITANIPFFGSSAFGAAQQNSVVTIFKENSIYLLNTTAKQEGQQPIQKLETEGKGCTAPYSVSNTRAGIIFANFTGIYRLRRDLGIDYVGKKVERLWKSNVNRDLLELAVGNNFSLNNQYKLSVPYNSTKNNLAFVYDYDREAAGQGVGSWTKYDNHPATGWANLLNESYFATTAGEVFSVRRSGTLSDYRDDSQAIQFRLLTRALDFGDSSIRKTFGAVISHFRTTDKVNSSVTMKAGVNLATELESLDSYNITYKSLNTTDFGDLVGVKVATIKSSLPRRLGNYLQLSYEAQVKDNPLELTGISFRVAGMNSKGITQAAES